MRPITYKLNIRGSAATTYYPAVSSFTDEVLSRAEKSVIPIALSYRDFLIAYKLEEPRSVEEYFYEMLNLGVLWRSYGATAIAIKHAPFYMLARLGEWRKMYKRLKPAIDFLRGVMLSFFLAPVPIRRTEYSPHSLKDIQSLVTWLEATGDFREDAFRYIRWLGFWSMQTATEFSETMKIIFEFTDWFSSASEERMGRFTPNVDSFIAKRESFYHFREDRFSCLRSRAEYHLNMIGAEIMNRAYRNEFLTAERRTVLLPGCLRFRSAEKCEGLAMKKGIKCSGCEPRCRVNQLREAGKRHNFDVMVIPHSTDLSQWSARPGEPAVAVVGVACLSVLVEGGWELKRNNIPAQCVLLNECGCKKHWHDEGFPTEVDVRKLKEIASGN